jgi:tRNA nucleotidyltransferase (CCA-adding enzyme)
VSYYRVGGWVRDTLLGYEPHDNDFVVVGKTVAEFMADWSGDHDIQAIGKSFPVFLVKHKNGWQGEFAFARRERKTGPGHNAFEVVADPSVTLEEDLLRRDLTINAIALPHVHRNNVPLETQVIDPFGGVADIKAGVLRHVSAAFAEDPLRVYRLARFAATLGFSIHPETAQLAGYLSSELYSLSGERVAEETRKAMLSKNPRRYFEVLLDVFALEPWFPELIKLVGVPAGPYDYHAERDAFEHTMMVLDRACWVPEENSPDIDTELVRWAALSHDLGKGITPKEELPRHRMHEERGVFLVEKFYDRLKMPTHFKDAAVLACAEHLKVHNFLEMKKGKMVDMIRRADRTKLKAEGLAVVSLCDSLGRTTKGIKDTSGPRALLACADAAREETGHPIPDSLSGADIGLYIRNRKGTAVRRLLKEKGFIGQDNAVKVKEN